jgi:hypothetical protein
LFLFYFYYLIYSTYFLIVFCKAPAGHSCQAGATVGATAAP